MDVLIIKQMLNSPMVTESKDSLQIVILAILKAYALMGLSKDYSKEVIQEEVKIIANEILKDLRSEKVLTSLRGPEIEYAIKSGIQGEFSSVKTYSLNYQTIYKWIKAYAYSEDRKQAINSRIQDNSKKALPVNNAPSKEQNRLAIIRNINDSYREFKELYNKEEKPLGFALSISDFGGVKSKLLEAVGVKPINLTLEEFFIQCVKKNIEKII